MLTTPIEGRIEVRDLHFRYSAAADPVLNGINLSVQKGQKIAFVGPSGCGKSTLFQLLLRFYDYDGEILVDGV
jgi:ABC-type multidrug transport system fused ATPase/permease subunit